MWIPERFAVEPVMGAAFRAFRAGAVRGYWLPAVVIMVATDALGRLTDPLGPWLAFATLVLLGALLQALLAPFIILTLLRRLQSEDTAIDAARELDFADFARMFGLYVVVNFAVLIGLSFFVLPGVLIASFFYFADVALIRGRCGPVQAIENSVRAGSGMRTQIFVMVLFLIGASLISTIGFGMIFAEHPLLDVLFDTAIQTPLFLYGYIVSVTGYLSLLRGAGRVDIGDTFT